MPQLQGEAHLNVRDDAFVQKQMIGSELAAVPRDALEAALPDRTQPAHPAPDRNAGASDREDQTQSFRQDPAARPDLVELPRRREMILPWRRLEQRNRRRAGACELRGDEVEKRSLASQHGAAFRDEVGRFQQDLRRAGRHDAGERPSRDRDRPLESAGGEQDSVGRQHLAAAVALEIESAVGIDVP
jgi:hypothetical protein